jgi:translin
LIAVHACFYRHSISTGGLHVNNLDSIAESIRATLEAKHSAREAQIGLSRLLIQHCGNAIRAMHRQEWESAASALETARSLLGKMRTGVADHSDLYHAGYTQDAFKEYVEAAVLYALLRDTELPEPDALGVERATYLNGLAEAASELRRYILDALRRDDYAVAEHLLADMDAIYDVLVTFDFPDAVSGGLRHRADNLRGVLERTRGDVTLGLRQQRLQAALGRAEARFDSEG